MENKVKINNFIKQKIYKSFVLFVSDMSLFILKLTGFLIISSFSATMSICQSKNWVPFEDTMDHDFDQFARARQETRDFDMFLKERHNSERYDDFFYFVMPKSFRLN